MIRISVKDINLRSPYEVEYAAQSGAFQFRTKQGRGYTVGYVAEELLSFKGIYQFFIQSDSHRTNDINVFATIISIIEVYFESGGLALTYICDIRDGKQSARNRLFNKWFRDYPFNHDYFLENRKIAIEDTDYYISIVIRKDEPLCSSIIAEFIDEIARLDSEDKQGL